MKRRVLLNDRLRIIINDVTLRAVPRKQVQQMFEGFQLDAVEYCISQMEEENCGGFVARYKDKVNVQVNFEDPGS